MLEKFKNLSFFNYTNFNILHTQSSYLNFLEIFYKKYNFKNKKNNLYYLYNTDFQKNINKELDNKKNFIIYQGHHFTLDAQRANLILPGLTFLEKEGLYLNMEGKFQKNNNALKKKTNQKPDNNIFKYLYIFIQKKNIINIKKKEVLSFNDIFLYLSERILILNINFKNKKKVRCEKKYNMFNLKYIYTENILENHSKVLNDSKVLLKIKNNFIKNY